MTVLAGAGEGDCDRERRMGMRVSDAFGLDGQVAIVTGAGAGIGRAIAEMFAAAGAAVVVSGRTLDKAEAVAATIEADGGRAIGVACDVTYEAARVALVETTLKAIGRLTILVNHAGGGGPKPFDLPLDTFSWYARGNGSSGGTDGWGPPPPAWVTRCVCRP
jgi:7-alpha-hydroxysteroid dehydrogenase